MEEYYPRKKENDLTLGPVFEDLAVMNIFLTLQEGQQLAREVELPTKFDDVVIRVTKGELFEYYFRQLKHKDTEKNSEQSITWNDLLTSDKKNAFNLKEYFESYLNLIRHQQDSLLYHIKELSIMTTVGFSSQQAHKNTLTENLYEIAKHLEFQSKKPLGPKPLKPVIRTKYYVTEKDLEHYFETYPRGVGNLLSEMGKRYKFSKEGIKKLAESLYSPSISQNPREFEKFLSLLIFDVNQPHIKKLRKINHSIIRLYFPFYLGQSDSQERCEHIKQKVLEIFKPKKGNLAKWVTVQDRCKIFEKFIPCFKDDNNLGSTRGYETKHLALLFEKLDFDKCAFDIPKEISGFEDRLKMSEKSFPVLNVYRADLNTTVIALKLYKILKPLWNRTLFIQLNDDTDAEKVKTYFEVLDCDLGLCKALHRECFCCVIEVSPQLINKIADKTFNIFLKLSRLRNWIQFIIITRLPIEMEKAKTGVTDAGAALQHMWQDEVEQCEDTALEWSHLGDCAKRHILEKSLFIANCASANLKTLGVGDGEKWIDSNALSELIVHDERSPLVLGLPKFTENLDALYIPRKLEDLKDASKCIEECNLLDDTFAEKLLVIVDLPGKGKRTLLDSLTNKFIENVRESKEFFRRPLFRINLLECRQQIKAKISRVSVITCTDAAVNFLVDDLLGLGSSSSALSRSLLKCMCVHSIASVNLLICEMDELVDNEEQSLVLNVTKLLLGAKGIRRIVLTTRQDWKVKTVIDGVEITKRFFCLKDFDKRDQVELIAKRWTGDLQKMNCRNFRVNEFAEKLINHIHGAPRYDDRMFLDMPLLCMIASECYFEKLQQHVEGQRTDFSQENVEMLDLYERFYENKIKISIEHMTKLFDESDANDSFKAYMRRAMRQTIVGAIARLSIRFLMKEKDTETLCRLNWNEYKSSLFEIDLSQAAKLGLIFNPPEDQSSCNREVKFIHRSFAEFSFATFLYKGFVEPTSELLDSDFLAQEILDATFRIIGEKILFLDKYNGIRQFLERVLSRNKCIPQCSGTCPFFVYDRGMVLENWPAISHEKFNSFFVKLTVRRYSKKYKQYTKTVTQKTQTVYSNDDVVLGKSNECLRKDLSALKQFGPVYVVQRLAPQSPSIVLMLMHCIKECSSRQDYSVKQREKLAYCQTIISLKLFEIEYPNPNARKRITRAFLAWFDPVKELTNEQNYPFSKWFFRMISYIVTYSEELKEPGEILALASEVVQHHRNTTSNFNDEVKNIATSIFTNDKIKWLCHINHQWTDEDIAKERGKYLINVLSLSQFTLPDTSLLDLQTDWFLDKLNSSTWELLTDEGNNVMNPFAVTETTTFLLKSLHEQKSGRSEQLLESYFNFLNKVSSTYLKALKDTHMGSKDNEIWSGLWLLILSDKITDLLENDPPLKHLIDGIRRNISFVFTGLNCCKKSAEINPLKSNWETSNLMKNLEQWLKEKLDIFWRVEGEIKFIDFLYKEQELPLNIPAKEKDDVTCLLFSKLVRSYIPDKLTAQGLEYFIKIIKNSPGQEGQATLWDTIMGDKISTENKHVDIKIIKRLFLDYK